MSDSCSCSAPQKPVVDPFYRKVLWVALLLNAAMFMVEVAGSVQSGSVSLLADAIDFFGDAANYGLSLAVLSMPAASTKLTKRSSVFGLVAFRYAR